MKKNLFSKKKKIFLLKRTLEPAAMRELKDKTLVPTLNINAIESTISFTHIAPLHHPMKAFQGL